MIAATTIRNFHATVLPLLGFDHERFTYRQLVLHDDRYTESIETTSITMKVAPQATVDLTRVW